LSGECAPYWYAFAETVRHASKWCALVDLHQNGAMDGLARTVTDSRVAEDFMVKLSRCQRTIAHLFMTGAVTHLVQQAGTVPA
jgi:hypothetical protein